MTEETNEKLVARLVQLADPGPAIPADGAARIKSAIRPAWRREVRARVVRRFAGWGAAAVVAASLLVFVFFPRQESRPPEIAARVEIAHGKIQIDPPLKDGAIVAGSHVATRASTRAALRLANGASLRLDAGSAVQLVSARVVALQYGAVYIDTAGAENAVEVRTDLGTIRDIGTQFEVRRERGAIVIRVREGSVSLTTPRESVRVEGGTELVVARDGSRRTTSIAPAADAWSWTHAVAPRFDIEGRSVSSFLDWVSRETGRPLRYEGEETERLARTTTLHGTLAALRPDEAAEVILPSAGLEAARDASGALVVKRSVEMKSP